MKFSIIFMFFFGVSIQACVSANSAPKNPKAESAANSHQVQFFVGQVQRSSLDGKQKYGPAFESVVRRSLDLEQGKIRECVFQENEVFITEMIRTNDDLVYNIKDLGGYSSGVLLMEDESAQAWSYDIDVLKPTSGKITGSLNDGNGARIFADGRMEIRKIWNNQMLISENYQPISKTEYLKRLPSITPDSMANIVAKKCK